MYIMPIRLYIVLCFLCSVIAPFVLAFIDIFVNAVKKDMKEAKKEYEKLTTLEKMALRSCPPELKCRNLEMARQIASGEFQEQASEMLECLNNEIAKNNDRNNKSFIGSSISSYDHTRKIDFNKKMPDISKRFGKQRENK